MTALQVFLVYICGLQLYLKITNGLEKHLESGGTVILCYDSLFYHAVMLKHACFKGYDVVNHEPNGLYPWAVESLFNNYLQRLLVSEGMEPDAFKFDWHKDSSLRWLRMSDECPRGLQCYGAALW